MFDYLQSLASSTKVLDLGSSTGSFPLTLTSAKVFRLDRDAKAPGAHSNFVQADAAALPFASQSFEVVVANHSFEHFDQFEKVAEEVGRILKPNAVLFISVPDASTITDRVYRWLGRGGGHVNAFTKAGDLSDVIVRATGLPLTGMLVLHSGMSFLNRRNIAQMPRRMIAIGYGSERLLMLTTYFFRHLDRCFQTRLSVYGWAYYFGSYAPPSVAAKTNVCIRCGSGHGARHLLGANSLRRHWTRIDHYRCPSCGARNLFTNDDS